MMGWLADYDYPGVSLEGLIGVFGHIHRVDDHVVFAQVS